MANVVSLQNHKDRWLHMSELAGPHKQDESVLKFNRPIGPMAFKSGVPPQVASQVETLHIIPQRNLPEWLDVLSSSCFALQHLVLNSADEESLEAARMRRLYILYRLPDLTSIDGQEVTELERQLARPDTPNGERVDRKEWLCDENVFDDDHDSEDDDQGEVVEVSLYGVVKRVAADPPQESFDEPEWVKPYEPQHQQNDRESPNTEKTCESTSQSPALLPSEVSEDETFNEMAIPNYLARFTPLHTLCSRNEKYLPMEEASSFEIDNPHRMPVLLLQAEPRNLKEDQKKPEIRNSPEHTRTTPERTTPKPSPTRLLLLTTPTSPSRIRLGSPTDQQKMSPSRSLTSPFPMQFRSRTTSKTTAPKEEPKEESRGTIDVPLSPTLIFSISNRRKKSYDRPPPCPGRVVLAESPHEQRRKRVLGRWRNRSQIRSTPMLSDDESEDDEDEHTA